VSWFLHYLKILLSKCKSAVVKLDGKNSCHRDTRQLTHTAGH
jgi:hypothetical protein